MPIIRKVAGDGTLVARDNFLIAFFCPVPFPKMASATKVAFDRWLAVVPDDAVKWAVVGSTATQRKKAGAKTIEQCAAMLDASAAAKRPLTTFQIGGPQEWNADHWFRVIGHKSLGPGREIRYSNLVEVWLPTEFVEAHRPDVVELARGFAEVLPYSSGYASPALSFPADSRIPEAARVIAPAAMRYPGYEVHHNMPTSFMLRGRVVGARWLTFLGPDLVQQLGGQKALASVLPGVAVEPAGHGLMLRAGAEPELGDTNKQIDTPLLRVVGRVLESVTFFGNNQVDGLLGSDPDRLDRWERRFLS